MIELDNGTPLYQWDLDRRVRIDGFAVGTMVEITDPDGSEPLCVTSYEEAGHVYAPIPNILLMLPGYIRICVLPDDGKPQERNFRVTRREKPEDYAYHETPLVVTESTDDKKPWERITEEYLRQAKAEIDRYAAEKTAQMLSKIEGEPLYAELL